MNGNRIAEDKNILAANAANIAHLLHAIERAATPSTIEGIKNFFP